MDRCAPLDQTHQATDPRTGARITSSTPVWFDYSTDDESELFSCCQVTTINCRRSRPKE